MIPGVVLMLAVLMLVLFGCRYRREELLSLGVKKQVLWFYSTGLYFREKILKNRLENAETIEQNRALLYRWEALLLQSAKRYALVVSLIFFGGMAAFSAGLLSRIQGQLKELDRPAFGEVRTVTVVVEGLEEAEEITVPVSGKDPAPEEMDAVFDATYAALQETILNGNASFRDVTGNLSFPKTAQNGISLTFESSDPLLLSNYGTVFTEDVAEEGSPVTLTVTLSYKGVEKQYKEALLLKLPPEEVLSEKEKLETLLKNADEDSAGERQLILPETLEGRALTFHPASASPYVLLFLFLLLAGLLLVLPQEKTKQAYKKRAEELEKDYPKLLLKLETLIRSGLSIRSAFTRIAASYEKQKEENGAAAYVYEEMCLSVRELEQGSPEGRVYLDFGRRIGLHTYIKLGNMLSQSVRQGISGLSESFEEEMSHAMEKAKNTALRKGEEAGTKILFPMMLMLLVVIATLVVPVFMTI